MPENEEMSFDLTALEGSFIDLFWEWWVTSTQALVDTMGSEEAIQALRPYYMNANTATVHILSDAFKDLLEDPDFASKMVQFASEAWFGGKVTIWESKDVFVRENFGCKTQGACKELCHIVCKELVDNHARAINRQMTAMIDKGLFKGDDHCIVILRASDALNVDLPPDLREIGPFNISEEDLFSIRLQYLSESWVFTTRAFLDRLGPKMTLDKLRLYMRHSGLTYGILVAEMFKDEERELQLLGMVIGAINDAHMRKGTRRTSPDLIEEVVFECPFSQAPPEVCLQYEAFFRGVCEAIDPDFEFAYDRMMSDGDETCHWVIRKKRR
jgi:hypothetical protein